MTSLGPDNRAVRSRRPRARRVASAAFVTFWGSDTEALCSPRAPAPGALSPAFSVLARNSQPLEKQGPLCNNSDIKALAELQTAPCQREPALGCMRPCPQTVIFQNLGTKLPGPYLKSNPRQLTKHLDVYLKAPVWASALSSET